MKNFLFTILLTVLSIHLFSQESIKDFRLQKQYLNIPVDMHQGRQKVFFILGEDTLTYSDIRIADGEPDYWVFKDVSAWKGEKLTLTFSEKVQGIEEISNPKKLQAKTVYTGKRTDLNCILPPGGDGKKPAKWMRFYVKSIGIYYIIA